MANRVVWPTQGVAADDLLARYLTRVAPGWALVGLTPVSAAEVIDVLWVMSERLGRERPRPFDARFRSALDQALEAFALGEIPDFADLPTETMVVLAHRLRSALAAALAHSLEEGDAEIMRLPSRLAPEFRRNAILIRLLFQGPEQL